MEDESDSDNEMIEQGVDAAAMPDRVEFVQENGSYSFQAQSMQKGPSPTPQGNGSYQGQQVCQTSLSQVELDFNKNFDFLV